jgi:hypothetical protein
MSVSNVSVNAASVNLLTVMNGIPRLLNGYGVIRKALDSVEFTTNPGTSTLISEGNAGQEQSDSGGSKGVNRRLARESRALQAAFQASDLAGTRRAIIALRQTLHANPSMEFHVSNEEAASGAETSTFSPVRQGGAGEDELEVAREPGHRSPRAPGS